MCVCSSRDPKSYLDTSGLSCLAGFKVSITVLPFGSPSVQTASMFTMRRLGGSR